jgi:hypothetical protein
MKKILLFITASLLMVGCQLDTQEDKDRAQVQSQQSQYAKGQPVPMYNWSLERDLLIKLYDLRNQKVSTHSVWRSDYGVIEGDCTSMGYGLPYDTSLTNPLQGVRISMDGGVTSIGQAEPNGVFASTNTAATWVMCLSDSGSIEPHYVESKVTVYPYPVEVDYENYIVTRAGEATAVIEK